MRILLVEDDDLTVQAVAKLLTDQHYAVDVAEDGQQGLDWAAIASYDLIILDVMLPKLDGLRLCHHLRQQHHHVPILLLTARSAITDKVVGLELGADDYVIKPFDSQELLARIRALLRRSGTATSSYLHWGDLQLNPLSCEVSYGQQRLNLTPKEYQLLELFLRNSRRVFSRSMLIEQLWTADLTPNEGTVTTHIMSLRHKLKAAGAEADLIETVYGLGYRLKPPDEPAKTTALQPRSTPQQTIAAMAHVWEEVKEKVKARVARFDALLVDLQAGTLSLEFQHQAAQEAHRLAGSLGIFGYSSGTKLAHSIETLLQSAQLLEPTQAQQLAELLTKLQAELERSPAVSSGVSAAVPPAVLLVDQDPAFAEQLRQEINHWQLTLTVASTPMAAREAIALHRPQAVLLDLSASDRQADALALLAELTGRTPAIPTLVLVSGHDLLGRLQAMRLGSRICLQKPIAPTLVLGAVAQILKQTGQYHATLLAVDDTEEDLAILQTLLEPWGFRLVALSEPQRFWTLLEQVKPDLLILDVMMPDIDGIELCRIVRNDYRWHMMPILFLSAYATPNLEQRLFAAGADDVLSKPIDESKLIARILNRLERLPFVPRQTR